MSAARLSVLVTPRASANSIEALGDGSLRLRVTAAPTDGGANRAVVRILGDALGVAPGRLTIVHGAAARAKLVEVREMTAAELAERVRKIGG
ncbi:MAG TPA: DUF167 domain-containing protein [Candidatus Limnocylindrales bacterium]|nr:DUF167 domain-containing protein [Candidatus Limnocylindrales bacterium]